MEVIMSSLSEELAEIERCVACGNSPHKLINGKKLSQKAKYLEGESRKITQQLKIGDVVKFKSGSPEMTIDNVYDGKCALIYFIGSSFNQMEDAPLQCLEIVRS
jgi:uncharacterized protein YodC (DUF2158 family)